MGMQVRFRRGTTLQHSTFTGAEGEITVDTTKKTAVVHDGTTAGGHALATEADVSSLDTAKADKVSEGTAGNLAALDADGNLVDSGTSKTAIETAISSLTASNIATTGDSDVQTDLNTVSSQLAAIASDVDVIDGLIGDLTNGGVDATARATKAGLEIGKNLFDKSKAVDSLACRTSSLTTYANATTSVSDWISVTAGNTMVFTVDSLVDDTLTTSVRTVQYTNSAKDTLIGYAEPSGPFVVPANAVYMRFSFTTVFKDKLQLELASVPTQYEGYRARIDDDLCVPIKSLQRGGLMAKKGKGINQFDKNSCYVGYTINASTGVISYGASRMISDFILVREKTKYTLSASTANQAQNTYVHWYTLGGTWISSVSYASQNGYTFLAPLGAAYARIETNKSYTLIQFEAGETATTYAAYVEGFAVDANYAAGVTSNDLYLSPAYWRGKTVAIDGDSLSHDQGLFNYWQYVLAQNLKMTLVSGTFTGSDSVTYTIGTKGIAGSRIAYGTEANTIQQCICRRYQYLPDTADLVIIFAGTNDWAHSGVPLGTMADRTDATFYGAMHVLCLGLLGRFPSKQIIFVTPIKRTTSLDTVDATTGLKLVQFVDAVLEVCGYYGIPVCDAFRTCTLNPSISAQASLYFADDTHLNAAGHVVLGNCASGYVKSLR